MAERSLNDILGFDATKHPTPTADLFAEVAADLKKERLEKARVQAKELLAKAIELQTQKSALEKKFRAETQKFDKEFGKIMKQIDGLMAGRDPVDEPEPTTT